MHRQFVMESLLITAAVFVVGLSPAFGTDAVDLNQLLDEMTDLERLSKVEEGYSTHQVSSYDRRSTDPAVLTEENWFANADRGHHLREEEVNGEMEYVLMDAEGPGAIVRFWSANPNDGGTVKVYLDRNTSPAIEMPLQQFLSGKASPFITPLCGERSRGWNCYFPLPYAEHCKVTITEGNIYYIINYRTYHGNTPVKTFSPAEAQSLSTKVQAVAETLTTPYQAVDTDKGERSPYDLALPSGASEFMTLTGPAALYRIICRPVSENLETALRGCIVEIAFDGNLPSVSAPLGDFFATAPGLNPYQSLPSGALEDGTLYSHWVMPFKEEAVITVRNLSDTAVTLSGEVGISARPWTEDSLYFHAKWRAEKDIPTRPMQDWNYLTADGKGRFCGVMLHIANPVTNWWGEGDEKIYVDGEAFPGFFGTGTEDYFGYAWCNTALFTHAYHNQVRCDGPGNMGHSCVSRFHIMDDIPFKTSLKFDLEVWHWADTKVTQAIMAYWYAAPDASDTFAPLDPDLLVVPELPEPPGVEGALEGEKMRIVSMSNGTADVQGGPWPWSRAFQLWWRHGAPGDTLVLGFDVEEAGSYAVKAAFTQAPDYGIHQLYINGNEAGKPLDLFHDKVVVAKERSLGTFTLKEGENLLQVKIIGQRPEASPGHMFGLDYLRLVR